MSILFTATAAISGLAAAALSAGLLRNKSSVARAEALNGLIDKQFKPTHKLLDARGCFVLAVDLKSAHVFIAEQGKDAIEPLHLPVDQLGSVDIAEVGGKRITELRLDLLLADERRTVVKVHILRSAASSSSPEVEQARSLAKLWQTRLTAHRADAASLRAALAPDAPQSVSSVPRWYPAGATALASVSVLTIAASLLMPSQVPVTPSRIAAAPVTDQPATALPTANTVASNNAVNSTSRTSRNAASELPTFLAPFEQRIDDISERSLVQTRRTNTDDVRKVLDELDNITSDLQFADAMVDSKQDQRLLDETRFHLASTLQDVFPRYRRLYGTALPQDTDLELRTLTGGYASRDLVLTNNSFTDDITRDVFLQTITADLNRLRFDTVSLRASGSGEYLETRELGSPDDASLVVVRQVAAALPISDTESGDEAIEPQSAVR